MRVVKSSTITEEKKWSPMAVRELCIKNNLYTMGTCDEYGDMLIFVGDNNPSIENIYRVAVDICNHSEVIDESVTVEYVMFLLNKDAVNTFYHISK